MTNSAVSIGPRTLLAKTCTKCGELKPGSKFRTYRKNYKQSECKDCQHRQAKLWDKRTNSISQVTAVNRAKIWTEEEISTLRELILTGINYAEISKVMGRSVNALTIAKHRYLKE